MKRHTGFTLIEVIVAMTILGLAFGVLFSLASRSLDGMRRAREVERRLEFARTKLAELRLVPRLKPGDRVNGSLEDGTRWEAEVFPFIAPVPDGPGRTPDSVVRLHFTLEWQGRNEPQKWSVDSYRLMRGETSPSMVSLDASFRAITAQ